VRRYAVVGLAFKKPSIKPSTMAEPDETRILSIDRLTFLLVVSYGVVVFVCLLREIELQGDSLAECLVIKVL